MQLEGQGNPAIGIDGVYREVVLGARIVPTERFDNPWYEGQAVDNLERLLSTIATA